MSSNITGRILALDPGTVRMGAALSDPLGVTVKNLGSFEGTGRKQFLEHAKNLVKKHLPVAVVVGVPINMDGTRGEMAKKAEKFARSLKSVLDVPVKMVDERLTTSEAERMLISADVSRKKRKNIIDGTAASIILKKYLDQASNRDEVDYESS